MSTTKQPGFFASIPASVYSPAFYAGVPHQTFWKGFWYLVRLYLVILALFSLFIFIPLWNNRAELGEGIQNTLNVYPEELVLTLTDSQVSTNVEEPYFISMDEIIPEEWKSDIQEDIENLMVIDTKTPFTAEQFSSYKSVIWIGQDAVYTWKNEGTVEVSSLEGVPDIVIDKTFVDEKIGVLWDRVKVAIPFLAVFTFIVFWVGAVAFRLVYLLILALLVLLMGNIMKISLDYAASYKIALYGVTLSSVLSAAIFLTSSMTGFNGFPFTFTILSLLVIAVNLQKAKAEKLVK